MKSVQHGVLLASLAAFLAAATPGAQTAPSITAKLLTSDIQVSADGRYIQTMHGEFRINNEAGVIQAGQRAVPYAATMQNIQILSAYTLKADGRKIPVDLKTIQDQPIPALAQIPMFSDQHAKVIFFPQLAPGDTAVYTTRLETKQPYFPGQFMAADLFLPSVPFLDVRETVSAPKSLPLNVENHGVTFQKQDRGPIALYRWEYKAPKAKSNLDVTEVSPLDRMPRFVVSSFKDYNELARAYARLSESQEAATPKVSALATQITMGIRDRRSQAQKLYEWVSHHIRYVALELGRSSFKPHPAETVISNGYGDCKDHAVLLAALLKAKGIESNAVLINSGNAYTLTKVPSFLQLNHVITWLPEFNLFVDSTAMVAPFGILPSTEYGKPIVYAREQGTTLGHTPTLPGGVWEITTRTESALNASGQLSGTTRTAAAGPPSILLRAFALAVQATGSESAATRLLGQMGYTGATGDLQSPPPTDLSPSYAVIGTFTVPGWLQNKSSAFYLPGGLRVLGVSGDGLMGKFYSTTKLKDDEPTPCFSGRAAEDLSLRIPDTFRFGAIPKNVVVKTPNIGFTANWTLTGHTLKVHREFVSKIDQPLCTGAVRKETAAALKQISDSYDVQISLAQPGSAAISQAASSGAIEQFNAGLAAEKRRDYKSAQQLFGRALADRSLPADQAYVLHVDRGAAYAYDGQYLPAVDDFTAAIRLNPSDPRAYGARASLYQRLKQNAFAFADYSKMIELSGSDVRPHMARAELAMQLGKYAQAVKDYNVVLRAYPGNGMVLQTRGIAYKQLGEFDHAADDLRSAIKSSPDDPMLAAYLCESLAHSHNPSAAIAQCGSVLKSNPYSATSFEARGYAFFRAKRYADALRDFKAAATIYPNRAEYLYARGIAKAKVGDRGGSRQDITFAEQLAPNVGRESAKAGLTP